MSVLVEEIVIDKEITVGVGVKVIPISYINICNITISYQVG